MDLSLTGKTALVTGSSRGIGRGIALALAQEGCDLLLTGTDAAALGQTVKDIAALGRRAENAAIDLRDTGAASKLVEIARDKFGRLDILVNNAGSTKRGDFFELSDADWADSFALK